MLFNALPIKDLGMLVTIMTYRDSKHSTVTRNTTSYIERSISKGTPVLYTITTHTDSSV